MRTASFSLWSALLASSLIAQVPRPAGDFSVMLPGGKALPLQSLKGKVVLLGFVYTTCPHCQALTKELATVQKDYAAKGVQIVLSEFNTGVNPQGEVALKEFVATYGPTFPVGMNEVTDVHRFLQWSVLSNKPLYVPHVVLIDRQGTIRGDYLGEGEFMRNAIPNLRAELDKLTAAAPARKTARVAPARK